MKKTAIFFRILHEFLSDYSGENIIMGVDFNTILDADLDKIGGTYSPATKYGQCIQELLIEELDPLDIDAYATQIYLCHCIPEISQYQYYRLGQNSQYQYYRLSQQLALYALYTLRPECAEDRC